MFRCSQCIDYVAGTQGVLDKHVSEHKTQTKTFSCGHCVYIATTDQDLEAHMISKHSYTVKSTKQCHFYKRGKCDRPLSCRFKHDGPVDKSPQISNQTVQREPPKCTRGSGCTFKSQGRCHYYHDDVGVQLPRQIQHQKNVEETQKKTTHRLWCQFQDTCKKGPEICPFRHYKVEFPRLPTKHIGSMFK